MAIAAPQPRSHPYSTLLATPLTSLEARLSKICTEVGKTGQRINPGFCSNEPANWVVSPVRVYPKGAHYQLGISKR